MSIHFLIVLWAEDEFEAIIQVHLVFLFFNERGIVNTLGTTTIILILFGMESWYRSNESGDS